jgi:hypothetical protein
MTPILGTPILRILEYSSGVSEILPTNTAFDRESASTKKLLNTSFEKFESSQGILTREQARKVGL